MGVLHWTGDLDSVIRLEVQENPKRLGSKCRQRFDRYKNGMTVREYVRACTDAPRPNDALADITWDLERRFISVLPPGTKV